MIRAIECLAQNLYISPPSLSQSAVTVVFDCIEQLDQNVVRYAENRKLLLKELPLVGLTNFAPPDGAFYIYANVSHLTNDSKSFCSRLLFDTGVAITPGVDFDQERGNTSVRFCYAGVTEEISLAVSRLKDWLSLAE